MIINAKFFNFATNMSFYLVREVVFPNSGVAAENFEILHCKGISVIFPLYDNKRKIFQFGDTAVILFDLRSDFVNFQGYARKS